MSPSSSESSASAVGCRFCSFTAAGAGLLEEKHSGANEPLAGELGC
jgi:hypothetical protein